MRKDITTIQDIRLLVDTFYDQVRKDTLIGPIFIGIIRDQWPAHLEKMYRFWQTVLLDERTYSGTPFLPHAKMPLEWTHFEQWLRLFNETTDTLFAGEKAERAKWQGRRMAELFHSKMEYYKNNSGTPLM